MKILRNLGLAMLAWPLISCGGGGGGDSQIAPPPVASISVSPQGPQLVIGKSLQMSAVARNASGGTVSGVTFSWTSDDTSKATVSTTGLVTGVGEGSVRISAAVGAHQGDSMLTVTAPVSTPAAVSSVAIDPPSAIVMEGATQQFNAKVYDAQGKLLTGRGVQWSALDNQVAVVDGSGKTTTLRVGVTTVNVRVEGKTAGAGLRVEAAYPFELVFDRRADDGTTGLYTLDISDPAAIDSPVPHSATVVSREIVTGTAEM